MSSRALDIHSRKKALRKELRERRNALCQANAQAAHEAAAIFCDAFSPKAGAIAALYQSIGSELDTAPLFKALWRKDIFCALPRVEGPEQPLKFHAYGEGDRLIESTFGVAEPHPSAPIVVPDILIVPLLGFDKNGFRLGYGGGFYDRTLSDLRRHSKIVAVGYGFAGQEVDEVPREEHDEPLDAIVTDQSAFRLER